jgi:hypothetical protein
VKSLKRIVDVPACAARRAAPPSQRGVRRGAGLRALLRTACAAGTLLALLPAGVARAASGLGLGSISPADVLEGRVYGEQQALLGENHIELQRGAPGLWSLEQHVEVGGQSRQTTRATLARDATSGELRLLSQEATTRDAQGRVRVQMWIDHAARRAHCQESGGPRREIALPEGDRVANNALPLLMRRLVQTGADELRFQFLLCRSQPRLVEVAARVESRGEQLRIRCDYDLGPLLTPLARALVPNFRYWFEPAPRARWIGHELMLERGEPITLVVREDIDPRSLERSRSAR